MWAWLVDFKIKFYAQEFWVLYWLTDSLTIKPTNSMEKRSSRETVVDQLVKKFSLSFMESEGSVAFSQEPTIGPYRDPVEPKPHT
jgi:hypothetical protein